ncbi:MAG: DUF3859 domain-containing protein [Rhodospirillaceae bacterium]|nr:DUF3859 domain-containing protein [Rhodospirillaceae bacterium]
MPQPRKTSWLAFALAPLFLLGAVMAAAAAQASGQVEIKDFGFYDLSVDGSVPAPEDISGTRNIVSNIRLQRQTDEIDAQLGRSFGFRFRITDPALLGKKLTLRTKFPPLSNPDTKRTSGTQDRTFVVTSTGELLYDGYRFDYDWEMAEGTWTFQILQDGKVLAEKKFKVIIPMN